MSDTGVQLDVSLSRMLFCFATQLGGWTRRVKRGTCQDTGDRSGAPPDGIGAPARRQQLDGEGDFFFAFPPAKINL
jgi:hypothetical protein